MDTEKWAKLRDEIALRIWKIECADMMIRPEEAEVLWRKLSTTGSSQRVNISYMAGCAIIALEDMGLLNGD